MPRREGCTWQSFGVDMKIRRGFVALLLIGAVSVRPWRHGVSGRVTMTERHT